MGEHAPKLHGARAEQRAKKPRRKRTPKTEPEQVVAEPIPDEADDGNGTQVEQPLPLAE